MNAKFSINDYRRIYSKHHKKVRQMYRGLHQVSGVLTFHDGLANNDAIAVYQENGNVSDYLKSVSRISA